MDARKHIINPPVTIITETVGSNQDKIARAIRSALAQDYLYTKLLIINYHPQPIVIRNIPAHANIDILNAEDVFTRRVDQHRHNLKQIDTPAWTILDDDDWIEPDHISQLVAAWNNATDRTTAPLQVCAQNYTVHYAEKTKPLKFTGWAVSLFETVTPEEIDLIYSRYPATAVLGSDTWIAGCSYWDRRRFDGRPTYHWDRIGSNHVSSHETNQGRTTKEKFEQTLNYWRIKLAARNAKLQPVEL